MYRPRAYQENDSAELLNMIEADPFGILVSAAGGLTATHLPVLVERGADGGHHLTGHMARGNPQWRVLAEGDEVLMIFGGPNAYISPRWYPDEPDVPTWNYVAVHGYGNWGLIDKSDEARRVLAASVAWFERGSSAPWDLEKLKPELVDRLQRGVQVFRIALKRLEGVKKLAQDKNRLDIRGVVEGLTATNRPGDRAVADLIASTNRARLGSQAE